LRQLRVLERDAERAHLPEYDQEDQGTVRSEIRERERAAMARCDRMVRYLGNLDLEGLASLSCLARGDERVLSRSQRGEVAAHRGAFGAVE
jgi:hypothetical protein